MWKQQLVDLPTKPVNIIIPFKIWILILQYKPKQFLGKGQFGIVYRINYEGGHAALKVIDRVSIENYEAMEREIKMLSLAKHRNIVQLHDSAAIDGKIYLVMEYVDGGSLHDFLQLQTQISYSFADGISWMLQAAEVILY